MQKKTSQPDIQKLHTLAERLSDAKVVISIILTVAFAIVGTALSALNFFYNIKSAPLASKVSAIEQRDINIEEALKVLSNNDSRLESKIDRITIKLIPNSNINYSK